MLFVIVISFKAHKVKEQEIKRKTFSFNRRGKPRPLEEKGLLSGSVKR